MRNRERLRGGVKRRRSSFVCRGIKQQCAFRKSHLYFFFENQKKVGERNPTSISHWCSPAGEQLKTLMIVRPVFFSPFIFAIFCILLKVWKITPPPTKKKALAPSSNCQDFRLLRRRQAEACVQVKVWTTTNSWLHTQRRMRLPGHGLNDICGAFVFFFSVNFR